jgi:hypothetical protein
MRGLAPGRWQRSLTEFNTLTSHFCYFLCRGAHLAASKLPSTRGGTSSASSSPPAAGPLPPRPLLSIKSFKNPYCWGPTCFRISGSMSFICFVSGCPTTDRRFSRTENYTVQVGVSDTPSIAGEILTLWSAEMDHGVVVFEHVHFFNVTKRLHAYPQQTQVSKRTQPVRATYQTS